MRTTTRRPSCLAVCRVSRGLSQTDLAQLAGVSRETVSRLERGGDPRWRTAQAVADALGFDLAFVFPKRNGEATGRLGPAG